jgi:hypothetical protein
MLQIHHGWLLRKRGEKYEPTTDKSDPLEQQARTPKKPVVKPQIGGFFLILILFTQNFKKNRPEKYIAPHSPFSSRQTYWCDQCTALRRQVWRDGLYTVAGRVDQRSCLDLS